MIGVDTFIASRWLVPTVSSTVLAQWFGPADSSVAFYLTPEANETEIGASLFAKVTKGEAALTLTLKVA